MAGLLDALNSDEARLGLGLLAAGGYSPAPMSFGQRVQTAMQGQDAQKRGALQNKLLQSQVDENASQAQLRQQQLLMAQKKQEMDAQFMGGGLFGASPAAPGAMPAMPGAAATSGQAAPSGGFTAQQISQQFNIPYEAVVADYKFNGGKKIAELISERTKPNWQNVNGNLVNTSAPGFSGGMQAGMASSADGKVTAWQPDGQGGLVVGAPKGALDTFRAYQGASADFKPIKVFNPVTQREEFTSEGAVVRPPPAANSGEAGMRAQMQGGMGADPAGIQREIKAVQTDLATKPLDPSSRAQLTAHLADLQKAAQVTPMPAGNVAAGPSAQEKLANEAGGKINDTWLKTSYEPVKVAGDAANDMLTNVQVARQSMRAMPGGTGWGAEAKATGAAILSSLGVAPKNAELYASNAQTFQSASMSNLQTVLNAAKGPQTEGDADRAGKTFAQLKNTPQANEFILDLSEAKAQRDQMKAQFYEQALPIARSKGDLQEVDREWRKRAPSVFNMPSMKKWGQR